MCFTALAFEGHVHVNIVIAGHSDDAERRLHRGPLLRQLQRGHQGERHVPQGVGTRARAQGIHTRTRPRPQVCCVLGLLFREKFQCLAEVTVKQNVVFWPDASCQLFQILPPTVSACGTQVDGHFPSLRRVAGWRERGGQRHPGWRGRRRRRGERNRRRPQRARLERRRHRHRQRKEVNQGKQVGRKAHKHCHTRLQTRKNPDVSDFHIRHFFPDLRTRIGVELNIWTSWKQFRGTDKENCRWRTSGSSNSTSPR